MSYIHPPIGADLTESDRLEYRDMLMMHGYSSVDAERESQAQVRSVNTANASQRVAAGAEKSGPFTPFKSTRAK